MLLFLRSHRNRLEVDQIFEMFTYTTLDEEHARWLNQALRKHLLTMNDRRKNRLFLQVLRMDLSDQLVKLILDETVLQDLLEYLLGRY